MPTDNTLYIGLVKPHGLRIALIVATDLNRAIGKDNTLPWRHKGDMDCFRRTTTGHMVLMGRKTFDSMGRKRLPKRHNIVLATSLDKNLYNDPPYYPTKDSVSLQIVSSLGEALDVAQTTKILVQMASGYEPTLFVIGGETLYRAFLPIADVVYHNVIDTEIEGADAWFPEMAEADWMTNHVIRRPAAGDDLSWREAVYVRRPT